MEKIPRDLSWNAGLVRGRGGRVQAPGGQRPALQSLRPNRLCRHQEASALLLHSSWGGPRGQGSSTNWALRSHPGFYLPWHLPWFSGIAKLTVFAISSKSQVNSSCTLPVLTSSNLHTGGGTCLRNVPQVMCVLSAHPSSTLLLFPLSEVTLSLKIFLQKAHFKQCYLKSRV